MGACSNAKQIKKDGYQSVPNKTTYIKKEDPSVIDIQLSSEKYSNFQSHLKSIKPQQSGLRNEDIAYPLLQSNHAPLKTHDKIPIKFSRLDELGRSGLLQGEFIGYFPMNQIKPQKKQESEIDLQQIGCQDSKGFSKKAVKSSSIISEFSDRAPDLQTLSKTSVILA